MQELKPGFPGELINKCERCVFWDSQGPSDNDGPKVGWCRRYPPVVIFEGDSFQSKSPLTDTFDWCGEFKTNLSEAGL